MEKNMYEARELWEKSGRGYAYINLKYLLNKTN